VSCLKAVAVGAKSEGGTLHLTVMAAKSFASLLCTFFFVGNPADPNVTIF
jgi:hypothetical protein